MGNITNIDDISFSFKELIDEINNQYLIIKSLEIYFMVAETMHKIQWKIHNSALLTSLFPQILISIYYVPDTNLELRIWHMYVR